jgi:hypothetical protein
MRKILTSVSRTLIRNIWYIINFEQNSLMCKYNSIDRNIAGNIKIEV